MREQDAQDLLAALHEAGHAVVASACGLPLRHALARHGRGEVRPDRDKAAMLSARHKRRNPGLAPRGAEVAAQMAMMGLALGGAAAVELREAARPNAAWLPHIGRYPCMSRGDLRGWHGAAEKLRGVGVNAGQAAPLICDWVDDTLTRHATTVARVAAALRRRGRLTGPELDRLLVPVAADPEPFARLLALAGRIMADPGLEWPIHARGAFVTPPPCVTGPSAQLYCAGSSRPATTLGTGDFLRFRKSNIEEGHHAQEDHG